MTDPTPSDDPGAPPPLYASFPRRIQAVLLDGVLLTVFLLTGTGFASSLPGEAARWANLSVLLTLFLYEPVLVSRLGGTLGHRAMNLRVVADGSGGRLSFPRALARFFIKAFVGLISFVFMAATRRHQALHDLAAGATVQVRDRSRPHLVHFVPEREEEPLPGHVSVGRRVVAVLCHVLALYLAASTGAALLISDDCLLLGTCTPAEDLKFSVLAGAWLLASVWAAVLGWRGQLLGARVRHAAPADGSEGEAEHPRLTGG